VHSHQRFRLLPDPGHRLHHRGVDRFCHAGDRPGLSPARSAHPLPEGMTVVLSSVRRYIRRNPNLGVGLGLLGLLLLFSVVGPMFIDVSNAEPLSVSPERPPSLNYPFGTDSQGRDLLAVMVAGTPLTLRIGLIAGLLGVAIGTVLAFIAAYYGGVADTIIKS